VKALPIEAAQRLCLASYNIHRCFGTDRKYLPERVVEVVQALDTDIIGLQEVDMRLLVDGRTQLDFLATSLRMTAIAGANIQDHRGHFGNALLTRLPIQAVRRLDLSVRRFEPRGAIDVDLLFEGRVIRVVATHLGLNAAERRLQVRHLLHALESGPVPKAWIVLGDFNEWKPTGGALRALNRKFGSAPALRTFPSRFPLLPLDRIWVWPAPQQHQFRAYATPLSRVASDHLPLRADITWRNGALGDTAHFPALEIKG
jgi:endonuclease/exonuclease/phosphatase family metal-dependent hydrolase